MSSTDYADNLIHKVDPNGDVNLVLPLAESVLAYHNHSLECPRTPVKLTRSQSSQQAEIGLWAKWKKKTTLAPVDWDDFDIKAEVNIEQIPDISQIEDRLEEEPIEPEPESYENCEEYSGANQGELDSLGEDEKCAQMLVSSKHLSLASSYFRRNLGSGLLESHTLNTHGHVEFRILGQDPQAMLIVMNIIHGRTRLVPRKVDLDELTGLAILVDYLDCHEAVEPFSDAWIDQLKGTIPSTYSKKLIQWLCISLIFRKESEFTALTRTAMLKAKGPIETLELPIRSAVVGKVLVPLSEKEIRY
jgi:hypothetical protein